MEGTVGEVALQDSRRPRPCQRFKRTSSSLSACSNSCERANKSDGPGRKRVVPSASSALGCAEVDALERDWSSVGAAGGSWSRRCGRSEGSLGSRLSDFGARTAGVAASNDSGSRCCRGRRGCGASDLENNEA